MGATGREHTMLRIEDDKAEAAMASLAAARATLRAGKPDDAGRSLDTAIDLLRDGLEPSRANRGQPRGPLTGRNRPRREQRKASQSGAPAH